MFLIQNLRYFIGKKKSFFIFCLLSLYSYLIVGETNAKCPIRMGSEFPPTNFLIIARRGATNQFPENTIPAFEHSLKEYLANALQVDLSFTLDEEIILWHDWDPDDPESLIRQDGLASVLKFKPFVPFKGSKWRKRVNLLTLNEFRKYYAFMDKEISVESKIAIPTFQEFMEWANQQIKLKLVLFKLMIPDNEIELTQVMLNKIRKYFSDINPKPRFQSVFSSSNKEVLRLVNKQYKNFLFAYEREVPLMGIVNYDRFTTVSIAMNFKNQFAISRLPFYLNIPKGTKPDPWMVYRFILTRDFKLRDNYKKGGFDYIKIISGNFNDEKRMECLVRLGVDGIITDKPKLLRRVALKLMKNLDF